MSLIVIDPVVLMSRNKEEREQNQYRAASLGVVSTRQAGD
jgi:hypothetical protein